MSDDDHETWRNERALMNRLGNVNRDIGRYVLRLLDVEAGRAPALPPAEEHQLGSRLVELGTAVQARAARRGPERGVTVDGSVGPFAGNGIVVDEAPVTGRPAPPADTHSA